MSLWFSHATLSSDRFHYVSNRSQSWLKSTWHCCYWGNLSRLGAIQGSGRKRTEVPELRTAQSIYRYLHYLGSVVLSLKKEKLPQASLRSCFISSVFPRFPARENNKVQNPLMGSSSTPPTKRQLLPAKPRKGGKACTANASYTLRCLARRPLSYCSPAATVFYRTAARRRQLLTLRSATESRYASRSVELRSAHLCENLVLQGL